MSFLMAASVRFPALESLPHPIKIDMVVREISQDKRFVELPFAVRIVELGA